MPQLHLYVADDVAELIRVRAAEQGLSTSRFLAKVATESIETGWPPGYFDAVCGSCPDFPYPEREPATEHPPLNLMRT